MKLQLARACDEAQKIGGAVLVREDAGYALYHRNAHVEMRWQLPDDLTETLNQFLRINFEPND